MIASTNKKINTLEERKMKNIEMMKQYIRENNLTGQVRELVNGADMDSEDAIEYVYDAHVMSKKDFAAKYFG
jgi:hypothetical protein